MKQSALRLTIWILIASITACSAPEITEPPKPEIESPTTPEEPSGSPVDEYTYIKVEYRKWQNGSFQPWSTDESEKTRVIDNMNWYQPTANYSETVWGGRIGLNLSSIVGKAGFFRIGQCGERYYLIDPDNGAMILHGIQHVRPGDSSPHGKAFASKFGSEQKWSEETGKLIAKNQLNCITYGSKRIEKFPQTMWDNLLKPESRKIAYTENLYLLRTFMWDMYKNLGYAFEDDTYNRLVLLFEPTFASFIDQLVQEKTELFAGDEHFIGYFLDNELPFASYKNGEPRQGVDIIHFLSLPDRYQSARSFAEKFMKENNISAPNAISEKDQEKFREAVADYYYRLTSETVRRHDPEHLVLGSRLHDWSKYNQKVVEACARYCDLVSINYYARWQPESDYLSKLKVWCGTKPFLVTEFYTKAESASYQGMPYGNRDGGGWLVRTQGNRGEFYQNFTLRLLETKNCVGWMHFEYNDEYGTNGEAVNKGIVSLEYTPYTHFLSYVQQLNSSVHSLIEYYDNN